MNCRPSLFVLLIFTSTAINILLSFSVVKAFPDPSFVTTINKGARRPRSFSNNYSGGSSLQSLIDENNNGEVRDADTSAPLFSRREAAIITVGGLAYGKVVASAISKIKRGDAYPPEHESRVSDVFRRTWMEAASAHQKSAERDRPLRVLEAGIGSNCRTVVRGLYDDATDVLSAMDLVSGVDFVGIDIDPPSLENMSAARDRLFKKGNTSSSLTGPLSFNAMAGDLVEGLPFPDGYFDAITCSLVLCSVTDQIAAVNELKRILNRDGGAFGYVEHVAVRLENEAEQDRSFLELQQRVFDPLQRAVAHNCHLHRETDRIISDIFDASKHGGSGELLQSERFFVDDMWPVSCQCSGVVKLQI